MTKMAVMTLMTIIYFLPQEEFQWSCPCREPSAACCTLCAGLIPRPPFIRGVTMRKMGTWGVRVRGGLQGKEGGEGNGGRGERGRWGEISRAQDLSIAGCTQQIFHLAVPGWSLLSQLELSPPPQLHLYPHPYPYHTLMITHCQFLNSPPPPQQYLCNQKIKARISYEFI